MANEASIMVRLFLKKGKVDHKTAFSYRADVAVGKGPTPGAITAALLGTDVDLSQLAAPGWCHLRNLDPTNYVQWGIRDPETARFYPVGKLLPGESIVLRLADFFGEEYYPATGTGTTAATNRLNVRAYGAPCNVLVEAFDS